MSISRRQVAAYLADGLESDRAARVAQVAAWMVAGNRRRDIDHLARDVASLLAERGYVTATATTARPLTGSTVASLENFIKSATGASEVELSTAVDPSLLGGINLTLPDSELDASVTSKLQTFVTEMGR